MVHIASLCYKDHVYRFVVKMNKYRNNRVNNEYPAHMASHDYIASKEMHTVFLHTVLTASLCNNYYIWHISVFDESCLWNAKTGNTGWNIHHSMSYCTYQRSGWYVKYSYCNAVDRIQHGLVNAIPISVSITRWEENTFYIWKQSARCWAYSHKG